MTMRNVPITFDDIASSGLDERVSEILTMLIGEVLPPRARGKITVAEAAALGYGPPCECGERGLGPNEKSCTECTDDERTMHKECETKPAPVYDGSDDQKFA